MNEDANEESSLNLRLKDREGLISVDDAFEDENDEMESDVVEGRVSGSSQ